MQKEAFEAELKGIRDTKSCRGRGAAIFQIKDKVVGKKTSAPEAVVLTDPVTKLEVNTPDEIKRVSLEYCSKLLTNREPKKEYSEGSYQI